MAVLGASASAFDNAGAALEAGAEVTMWSRRPHLPQVNFTRGMVSAGFLQGFPHLPDATRWSVMTRLIDEAAPPPHESVLRCQRQAGFTLRLGEGWSDLRALATDVEITVPGGPERYGAAILATGYAIDLSRQPHLEAFHASATLWRDRVSADRAERYPELADHPYLDEGFALVERETGSCPLAARLRLFGTAATVSQGVLAGDIPMLAIGATRLARKITEALFAEDADRHVDRLFDFDEPELASTAYYVPPHARHRR